jgi:shikimate kinase
MPTHLCLVGLRCSGKTTIGRALAERLGRAFFDLDQVLAEMWSDSARADPARSVPAAEVPHAGELLARFGAAEFRQREHAALAALLAREEACVIATGAGCVETEAVRELLASRARVLWLEVPLPELERRMRADPTPRPPLLESAEEQAGSAREQARGRSIAEIPRVHERRAPLYRGVADERLDCRLDPPAAVVERLLARLSSRESG